VVTFFVTSMVVFMMFSSKSVVLGPYTMKTIPVIKTDRAGKKRCGFFSVGKHNGYLDAHTSPGGERRTTTGGARALGAWINSDYPGDL
jgi:hypothetical protein